MDKKWTPYDVISIEEVKRRVESLTISTKCVECGKKFKLVSDLTNLKTKCPKCKSSHEIS